jgi:hypothetical protein
MSTSTRQTSLEPTTVIEVIFPQADGRTHLRSSGARTPLAYLRPMGNLDELAARAEPRE